MQSVLFWTTAMFCYAIFRYLGVEDENALTLNPDVDAKRLLIEPVIGISALGFGLGLIYSLIDFLLEKYMVKKTPLGINLLLKTTFHFIATILLATIIGMAASQVLKLNYDFKFGWWVYDKRFWSIMFYIIIFSIIFSLIKIAVQRFGKGQFLKTLMGSYKNPKEEKRIFMFLDLKGSTAIAEKLGHHKYSQLVQDCFLDLNEVVLRHAAEIYQYVGDEAVLSWPYKIGLANNNCIGLFFAFQEQRLNRKKYYIQKYDIYPEFKAGLHGGILMVAEVGFVKKELAYHGDVINTSARIQSECNAHNVSLLLSESLLSDLNILDSFTAKSLGKVSLKGKLEEVKIHSIEMNFE
ncbi:adenylate/guanylate cyclase domain-containing protein [uncultured Maribacter sp.]|uniref:adenylate/guanylate cyclase domain-containing protein n=1 Tax=uncultured Maribacter sp. TaxID=431308 RepID=UPI00262359F5|nr:adenylate/guanylate cyclase domain-containing protein [uncultured Maribacter sp.]